MTLLFFLLCIMCWCVCVWEQFVFEEKCKEQSDQIVGNGILICLYCFVLLVPCMFSYLLPPVREVLNENVAIFQVRRQLLTLTCQLTTLLLQKHQHLISYNNMSVVGVAMNKKRGEPNAIQNDDNDNDDDDDNEDIRLQYDS